MTETGSTPHKRRPHYAGKYPRKFEEKYKELQPDKYRETIEHVKDKGITPAGTHIPIMVTEILEHLAIQPGERGLDCTFGYGGHTTEMLKTLNGTGLVVSLDLDPEESAKTEARLRKEGFSGDRLQVRNMNFADIDKAAAEFGEFDFVLADLGVSSMQIDDPKRGFSYKTEGPLDLRMNQQTGITAAERLKQLDKDELTALLIENSDEPYAEEIASAVTKALKNKEPVETTGDLRKIIENVLSGIRMPEKERKEAVRKSCQRTFQALRIDINHEFDSLETLMQKLPDAVKPGGRIAILTFHSGEDRLVKDAFRSFYRSGIYSDIAKDVIRPSKEECVRNPRAKSTKLRWAVRSDLSLI